MSYTATETVRFYIVAGAMQPNGAWARSQSRPPQTEAEAREEFGRRNFEAPESGKYWGQDLTLWRAEGSNREVIARRVA